MPTEWSNDSVPSPPQEESVQMWVPGLVLRFPMRKVPGNAPTSDAPALGVDAAALQSRTTAIMEGAVDT